MKRAKVTKVTKVTKVRKLTKVLLNKEFEMFRQRYNCGAKGKLKAN